MKPAWIFLLASLCLTGCVSHVVTGAGMIYDRHKVYLQMDDFQLGAQANRVLYKDNAFKIPACSISVAVFNRDVLLVGHVPSKKLRDLAYARISALPGIRRLFNQIEVNYLPLHSVQDSWITTKIRSQIFAHSEIDPHQFKVITCDRIVYLMGDVIPDQASQVILFARQCRGVKRVVKLFKYYNLSDRPAS